MFFTAQSDTFTLFHIVLINEFIGLKPKDIQIFNNTKQNKQQILSLEKL